MQTQSKLHFILNKFIRICDEFDFLRNNRIFYTSGTRAGVHLVPYRYFHQVCGSHEIMKMFLTRSWSLAGSRSFLTEFWRFLTKSYALIVGLFTSTRVGYHIFRIVVAELMVIIFVNNGFRQTVTTITGVIGPEEARIVDLVKQANMNAVLTSHE